MIGVKVKAVSAPLLLLATATLFLYARAENSESRGQLIKPGAFYPVAKDNKSERGKTLFSKYQCSTCHTIGGKGGCLAPPLDGVGARRTRKFLNDRIVAGGEKRFFKLYGMSELMPHVRIPADDASAVVQYLLTVPPPKIGFQVTGHDDTGRGAAKPTKATIANSSSSEDSVKRGRQLLNSKGCLACHSLGNLGGTFAPKFDSVGSRLSKNSMEQQMKNAELLTLNDEGEYGARGTVMPPMNLSQAEIEDITNYLVTLK